MSGQLSPLSAISRSALGSRSIVLCHARSTLRSRSPLFRFSSLRFPLGSRALFCFLVLFLLAYLFSAPLQLGFDPAFFRMLASDQHYSKRLYVSNQFVLTEFREDYHSAVLYTKQSILLRIHCNYY